MAGEIHEGESLLLESYFVALGHPRGFGSNDLDKTWLIQDCGVNRIQEMDDFNGIIVVGS